MFLCVASISGQIQTGWSRYCTACPYIWANRKRLWAELQQTPRSLYVRRERLSRVRVIPIFTVMHVMSGGHEILSVRVSNRHRSIKCLSGTTKKRDHIPQKQIARPFQVVGKLGRQWTSYIFQDPSLDIFGMVSCHVHWRGRSVNYFQEWNISRWMNYHL